MITGTFPLRVAVVLIGVIYNVISGFMFYTVYGKLNHVADVSEPCKCLMTIKDYQFVINKYHSQ